MKTRWRKLFSLLLALTMLTGLMPGISRAVQAAGSSKALQPAEGSAANIEGERKSNVYFGNYLQSSDGNGGFNNEPIKWLVLENTDGQLFLIADQGLDCVQYHTEMEEVTWETSTIRSWLNGYEAHLNKSGNSGIDYRSNNFMDKAFSAEEKAAIALTKVVNDDNPKYGTEAGNNTTDKVFLLSRDETLQYFKLEQYEDERGYAYVKYACMPPTAYAVSQGVFRERSGACCWWLRSPGSSNELAANVFSDRYLPFIGVVNSYGYKVDGESIAVRPALKIDLNSVLFATAAEGGKTGDGALALVEIFPDSVWKLTIMDETRNGFAASTTGRDGDFVRVNYSGATTGSNEYISAIIKNSAGAVTYYGRLAQAKLASGIVSVDVSGKLNAGDTLYVFNEQYNGDYQTDYASALKNVFSNGTLDSDPYNLKDETYSFRNYGDSDSLGGHCFGMSMTSAFYHNELLPISRIGGSETTPLYSFSDTQSVREPICYYQGRQGSFANRSTVAGGSYYLTERFDIASDWQAVVDFVKNHEYDGTGLLQIGFRKASQGGHAINFLRYEKVNGQDRIYAYDNNFPEQETYFYQDSSGKVWQTPQQTFSGAIDCICLRNIRTYFSLVDAFDMTHVLYIPKDAAIVQGHTYFYMDGAFIDKEYVMYEIPSEEEEVTIIPLRDDASFIYMDTEYSFGKVTEETIGKFKFSTLEEEAPISNEEFHITEADSLSGDINGDGKVNIFDVIRLLKKVTGEVVETFANTDVNGDGKVNIFDVIRLLKKVTGEAVEIH